MARSLNSRAHAAGRRREAQRLSVRRPGDRVSLSAEEHLDPEEARRLIDLWGMRARCSEAAHYDMAASYLRRDRWLSLAVVVISLVTGSGIFATYSTSVPKSYRFVFGGISLLAAVLAGVSRSLRYSEEAQQNRQAGALWAPIVNSAERLRATIASANAPGRGSSRGAALTDDIAREMDALQAQMDGATRHSPSIPQHFFNKHGLARTFYWQPERTSRRSSRHRSRRQFAGDGAFADQRDHA